MCFFFSYSLVLQPSAIIFFSHLCIAFPRQIFISIYSLFLWESSERVRIKLRPKRNAIAKARIRTKWWESSNVARQSEIENRFAVSIPYIVSSRPNFLSWTPFDFYLETSYPKSKSSRNTIWTPQWTKTTHKTSIIVMVFFYIRTFGDDLWHVDRHSLLQNNCVIVAKFSRQQSANTPKWLRAPDESMRPMIRSHFINIAIPQSAA